MLRNNRQNKKWFWESQMSKGVVFGALVILFVATMASVGVVEAADADEGKIAFESAGNIHIINPDGTNEIRLTEGWPDYQWLPDGKKIAYGYEEGYYVINVDGTGKTKLPEAVSEPWSWSPDGRKILFIETQEEIRQPHWEDKKLTPYFHSLNQSICTVNADGSNLVRLMSVYSIGLVYHMSEAVFSLDGKKIAYINGTRAPTYYSICIMNPDGSDKTELVREEGDIECLSWSPDGKKLTYTVGNDIFVIDADGTNKTTLAKGKYHVWSPDGEKIAYSDVYYNLWVMNSDGTGKTKIVEREGYRISIFSWSPDGKKIVYGKKYGEEYNSIYIVNADGSGLTALAYGNNPQWSPVRSIKPTPTSTSEPTITPTLVPTEDAFNYNGEYTLDEAKLRDEERKALPYVMKYAKEYKVSPCLIMAVIRQESDFFDYSQDPNKDRDKFDIGYMQVSHIAAIDTYKEYTGDKYTGTKEEWQKDGLDPNTNIKYGTRYLRIQYNRIKDHAVHYEDVYDDFLESTVSAYNAGHPTKDNEKYVEGVINGRNLIDGQRRGYEFFLTIRVTAGGTPTSKPTTKASTPEEGVPGFEAVFAIAGLLAVAYLLRRRE